jgi:RimJ/RimL family protein N-acetyltransferase
MGVALRRGTGLKAPRLTDGRVTLRAQQESDVDAHVRAFAEDAELARLLGYEQDETPEGVRRRMRRTYAEPPELRQFEFAIADAGDDSFLGALMIHSCDWRHRRAEVGFWVVPSARGRGVLSAALALFLDWAFVDLGLERMEMTALPDNDVVPRIADRFGFVREGVLRKRNFERGERVDLVLWGLLRDDRNAGASPVRATAV